MRPTEMLNKITSLLGTQVQLEEMKLENGATIEADSFAGGENVFIVTEDEKVPLPVGDYTLEDGKILVVSEEGVISEIKETMEEESKEEELSDETVETGSKKPAPSDDEPSEEEPSDEPNEEKEGDEPEELSLEEDEKDDLNKIVEEVVAAVTPIIDEMKQELAYVKEELGKIKGEEEEKEEMEAQVKEELSTQPATKPLKHNPESEPNTKALLARENRPLRTMDRVLNRISNLK